MRLLGAGGEEEPPEEEDEGEEIRTPASKTTPRSGAALGLSVAQQSSGRSSLPWGPPRVLRADGGVGEEERDDDEASKIKEVELSPTAGVQEKASSSSASVLGFELNCGTLPPQPESVAPLTQ